MARQSKKNQGAQPASRKEGDTVVQTLSNTPVEGLPEEANTVTQATADAAPSIPVDKGEAPAVAQEAIVQANAKKERAEAELAELRANKQMTDATTVKQTEAAQVAVEAAAEQKQSTASTVRWFRVLNDKFITGNAGFRSKVRAGKEFNTTQYNPAKLRQQGVKLEEISEEDRGSF